MLGDGELTGAIDAYGDVVDLRPGPAGPALLDNPAERQAVGTVPADTGIVPRVAIGGGPALPLWRADRVRQRYRRGTNVLLTAARFGAVKVEIEDAVRGLALARIIEVSGPPGVRVLATVGIAEGLNEEIECEERRGRLRLSMVCLAGPRGQEMPRWRPGKPPAAHLIATVSRSDRSWLLRARPLGAGAPAWARGMYERSLLVLRALGDRRTGAIAAGARDGWAYVWPRDAGAAVLALASAGYRAEARRAARFLLDLQLDAAARFHGDGTAVDGREAQGDAWGWTTAAARAGGLPLPSSGPTRRDPAWGDHPVWRDRPDYQEKSSGDYLGNALASLVIPLAGEQVDVDGPKTDAYRRESAHQHWGARAGARIRELFGTRRGLLREAGAPSSGVDSAAAWAVRPFTQLALFPLAQRSLQRLIRERGGRLGIVPSEDWPEDDPWTAPTAWVAWAYAALSREADSPSEEAGSRLEAHRLLAALRRAATPAGTLPERVDAHTGVPRSTTPLAWSHAFAILALLELWPNGGR